MRNLSVHEANAAVTLVIVAVLVITVPPLFLLFVKYITWLAKVITV